MSEEYYEDLLDNYSDDVDENTYNELMSKYGFTMDELTKELESYQGTIDVNYKLTSEDSVDPKYAYETDSGFDLHSIEEIVIEPFGRALIPTGLHIDIPNDYEIQVRSKSGLALKQGLMVLNSPGTVDNSYTGEIKVILFNSSNKLVTIEKGQKVAQAVVCPVVSGKWLTFKKVDDIQNKERSDNGFGSTGLK